MKPQLVIIGGGFAGVWATAAASDHRTTNGTEAFDITLVTTSPDLIIRPRLYEADLTATVVPLEPIVTALSARLVVDTVTGIDIDSTTITLTHGSVDADAIVLAAGSTTPLPAIPGLAEHAHRIDTLEHARQLRTDIDRRRRTTPHLRVTVVGGGLTGIELAAELASVPDTDVTLIDARHIGEGFGADGSTHVRDSLTQLSVRLADHTQLLEVNRDAAATSSGSIAHDLLVWCGGLRANPLTALVPAPRDELGRLTVDAELRVVGVDRLWAAGDVARSTPDGEHIAPMSCQFAIPTGMIAGHNAAAHLLGGVPEPFETSRYVTCVDLGDAGALFTTGWDRIVELTGTAGKDMKRFINQTAIYPPADPDTFKASTRPGATLTWG